LISQYHISRFTPRCVGLKDLFTFQIFQSNALRDLQASSICFQLSDHLTSQRLDYIDCISLVLANNHFLEIPLWLIKHWYYALSYFYNHRNIVLFIFIFILYFKLYIERKYNAITIKGCQSLNNKELSCTKNFSLIETI
jgi:hypothetical protein